MTQTAIGTAAPAVPNNIMMMLCCTAEYSAASSTLSLLLSAKLQQMLAQVRGSEA
jgi:hypothetical protein